MPTVHARAIKRAAEICGEADLAHGLGVTRAQLQLWMRGLAVPPSDVFFKVVDILWDEAAEELQRKPDAEARDPDSA